MNSTADKLSLQAAQDELKAIQKVFIINDSVPIFHIQVHKYIILHKTINLKSCISFIRKVLNLQREENYKMQEVWGCNMSAGSINQLIYCYFANL